MRATPWAASALLAVVLTTGCGASSDADDDAAGRAPDDAASASAPASEDPAAAEAVTDWYVEQYGEFEILQQTGTGDAVIPLPAGAATAIVTTSHDGAENFIVTALDAANGPTDLLVNAIGAYAGVGAMGLMGLGGEPTSIQIQADGAWTITVAPVSAAPELPAAGGGDGVFKFDGDAKTATLSHDGAGNFIVTQIGGTMPNLMVNEIGAYSGTVPMQAGPSVIVVQADGGWSIA